MATATYVGDANTYTVAPFTRHFNRNVPVAITEDEKKSLKSLVDKKGRPLFVFDREAPKVEVPKVKEEVKEVKVESKAESAVESNVLSNTETTLDKAMSKKNK